jgi:DNA-directed RNA polymerase subunit RPC12/RpoP
MANLVVLCLLHGQKCQWQKLKTFMKRTNHPMEAKTCRASFPCSQQHYTTAVTLTTPGPCELVSQCLYASRPCKLSYNENAPLMRSRWLFCWGYKQTLEERRVKCLSEEVVYQCLECGGVFPKSKWEEIEGRFRCPNCGHKVAKKQRPPIVKRVKAV